MILCNFVPTILCLTKLIIMICLYYDLYYDGFLVQKDVEVLREYDEKLAFTAEFHLNYLILFAEASKKYLFPDVYIDPVLFTFRNIHTHI